MTKNKESNIVNKSNAVSIYSLCAMFATLILIYLVIITIITSLSPINGIIFLLYQIFAITVPGIALMLMFKFKVKNGIEFFAFSYAMGYCLNIALYFFIVPFGLQKFTKPIVAAYICMALFFVIFKIINNRKTDLNKLRDQYGCLSSNKNLVIIGFVFLTAVFIVQFLVYGLNNLLPIAADRSYYMDQLYWVGNIVALAKDFPPINIRAIGTIFNYHYFSSLQLSLVHLTTNINIADLGLGYSYIQSNILYVMSGLVLFQRILKSRINLAIALTILFFSCGIENLTIMNNFSHIYRAPFGFEYGLSFGMIFFTLIIMQWQKKKFNFKIFIFTLIVFAVCCGVKAPVAIVYLCGLGIFCFYWLFVKKQIKMSLLYGISCISIFGFLYKFILSGYMDAVSESGGTVLGFSRSFSNIAIFKFYKEMSSVLHIPETISIILLIFAFVLFSNMAMYSLSFFALLKKIRRPKNVDALDCACVFLIAVGIVATLLIGHVGLSQMYYLLASLPIVLLFGVKNIKPVNKKDIVSWAQTFKFKKEKILKWGINSICFFAVVISVLIFISHTVGYTKRGINNFSHGVPVNYRFDSNYVSTGEYAAYEWIRKNTSKDDMIASNITLIAEDSDCVSVFTERQMWIEGTRFSGLSSNETEMRFEIINGFMNNNINAYKALKFEGVDYFFLTKRSRDAFKITKKYNIVYKNEDAAVIKL